MKGSKEIPLRHTTDVQVKGRDIYLPVCLSVDLIYLSVCLSIYLSACLSVSLDVFRQYVIQRCRVYELELCFFYIRQNFFFIRCCCVSVKREKCL